MTRFYFKNAAPSFQPALKGAWDTSAAVVYRELGMRDGPINTVSQAETSSNTQWDMALLVLVMKLDLGGTIPTGTNVIDVRYGRDSDTASSFVAHAHWWVSQGGADTVRHTLVTNAIGGTNWSTSPLFSFSDVDPGSNFSITAGDHLVIELGARGITSSTTSRTATLYYGGLGAPDPVDGTAVTDQAGWIDFVGSTAEALVTRIPVHGTPMMMAA